MPERNRNTIILPEVACAVEQRWVEVGWREYVSEALERVLGDGNEKLHGIWVNIYASGYDEQREMEGSALTYDALQRSREKLGKPPLIISGRVIESIGNDRMKMVGSDPWELYEADLRYFHSLRGKLSDASPDFHRIVDERSRSFVIKGDVNGQIGFLSGVKEAWKMFLRQQQHPLSVFFFGYKRI